VAGVAEAGTEAVAGAGMEAVGVAAGAGAGAGDLPCHQPTIHRRHIRTDTPPATTVPQGREVPTMRIRVMACQSAGTPTTAAHPTSQSPALAERWLHAAIRLVRDELTL